MNLKKLPPSMVMVLGLGCATQPCLSPPVDPDESSTSGTDTGSDTGSNTVGPCLGAIDESTDVGPCLDSGDSFTSGTDTGSGSGSGSGSDTSSGSDTGSGDSGSTGAAAAGDPDDGFPGLATLTAAPSERERALGRVLDRDILPADIAARLRKNLGR